MKRLLAIPGLPYLLILGAGILAWSFRYWQEDAFITFRYAKHLAEGLGPVYNAGSEPVEGYSNFLWMLWSGFWALFTDDFPHIIRFSAILIWMATLWMLFKAVSQRINRELGLLAIILVGYNYFLASAIATGLETALASFLVTWGMSLILSIDKSTPISRRTLMQWGLAGFLAVLTRPDLALLFLIMFGYVLYNLYALKNLRMLRFLIPILIIGVGMFAWKYSIYGNLLPNTFYVKGDANLATGLKYVALFFIFTGFVPSHPQPGNALLFGHPAWIRLSSLMVGAWYAYLVFVGGDYMGFRLMVPIAPIIVLIWAGNLWNEGAGKNFPSLITGAIMVLALPAGYIIPHFVQMSDIIQFRAEMKEDSEGPTGLKAYADALTKAFGNDSTIRLATGASGIIPYYTDYHTIDMMGLNDAWVARNAKIESTLPGHDRFADYDYIVRKKANIVVGRLIYQKDEIENRNFEYYDSGLQATLPNFRSFEQIYPLLIFLKLPETDYYLLVIRLFPHPAIDAAISAPGENGVSIIKTIR